MAELAKRTPSILGDFIDRADKFVNYEKTLQALVNPHKELNKGEQKGEQLDGKVNTSQQGGNQKGA